MGTAGRVYVLSAAVALVAMASRARWINWPVICHQAMVMLALGAGLLTFGALMVLLIGVPAVIIIAISEGVAKLAGVKPAEGPSA